VTGRGCAALADLSIAQECLGRIANRVSRLDIANDMECSESPATFANSRRLAQTISIGYQSSPTGETVYLGSMKSDRYARVYRYAEPHPRSAQLRFEAVYRRDYAKALAWAILAASAWGDIAALVGERYDFQSMFWQPKSAEKLSLKLPTTTKSEDKTLTWLYRTVAPSIVKAITTGAMKSDDFRAHINKLLQDAGHGEIF
jgi:DNA relaxase NicK